MEYQAPDGNAVDILKGEIAGLEAKITETLETKQVEASAELKAVVDGLRAEVESLKEKQKEAEGYYTPGAELSEKGEEGKFSFARFVQAAARETVKGERGVWDRKEFGYERDYRDEMRKKLESGVIKTYTGSTDAAGAYLIGTDMQAGILPFLRSSSVAYQAGVRRMDGLTSNISWVKGEGGTQHYWVDTEAEESITESRSTFSTINSRPHPLACLSKITWGMLNQPAESIEAFIREEMAAEMALAEDKAIFLGPGSNSEPLGILNTSGILTNDLGGDADASFGIGDTSATATLTGAAYAYFRAFVQELRSNNSLNLPGARLAYVMEDAVAEDLEAVVRPDTGLPAFLGDNDALMQNLFRYPTFVSTNIDGSATDRTALFGDFNRCVAPHWGAMSFDVSDSDDDDFKKARVTVRGLTAMDVAVLEPKAFCEATTYADS